MIHVKCLGSTTKRAPHGQEAHRNEIFDYHDALHSADMMLVAYNSIFFLYLILILL